MAGYCYEFRFIRSIKFIHLCTSMTDKEMTSLTHVVAKTKKISLFYESLLKLRTYTAISKTTEITDIFVF